MSILAPVTFEVTHLDGSKETVELKRLSLRQLYRFVEQLGGKDPADLVSLATGKPVDWFDTLEDDSAAQLSKMCHAANFPRAERLAATDPFMALRMVPFYQVASAAAALTREFGTTGSSSSRAQRPSESAGGLSATAATSPSTNSSPPSPATSA